MAEAANSAAPGIDADRKLDFLVEKIQKMAAGISQIEAIHDGMKELNKTNAQMFESIGKLVERMAHLEIELADVRIENQNLSEKIESLNNRLTDIEKRPLNNNSQQALTFANVIGSGLPQKPRIINLGGRINNNAQKQTKPLQPLYPKASREVVVSFVNAKEIVKERATEDRALTVVNDRLEISSLKKRLFHGARFSIANNLVLTTGLHDCNSDLVGYLADIEDSLAFIGPATATISAPWSKFLLHGVPTHLALETIRRDVEAYCHNHKLGQTPRWLVTEDNRKDKEASTIVLAFLGSVTLADLGGRTLRVGNRSCTLTKYIQFGPQTQCLNCQAFGHPKEFCTAGPRCVVCSENHQTTDHKCNEQSCKGGYRCLHIDLKCVNCQGPHRASNRNCPEKIKRSQEFRLLLRKRVEDRMDL